MNHVRSLLARETLENHPGVAIDAEVVDSLSVGRGRLRISATLRGSSSIPETGQGATTEGLHFENQIERKENRNIGLIQRKRGEERRGEGEEAADKE